MQRAIVLAFVALAIGLPVHSQQPPAPPAPPPFQPGQQSAKPEIPGSPGFPFVVRLDSAQAEQQAAETRHERASDRLMVGLTFAMVLVAALQLVMFVWQLAMMRRTVKDATLAADAAKESADAAKAGLVLAKKTAKRELRAYLSRSGDVQWRQKTLPEGKVFEFLAPVINSGQTPAYDIKLRNSTLFYQMPLPEAADLTLPPDQALKGILGPGEKFDVAFSSDALDDNQSDWMFVDRSWTLYLVAEITYTDAFKGKHNLLFCEGVAWSYVHTLPETIPTYATDRHNSGN